MSPSASPILGDALPNIPWEDRPAGSSAVMWRSARNPVIPHDQLPESNSIYNGSAAPFRGRFAGLFRIDDKRYRHRLHAASSDDGVAWDIDPEPIRFTPTAPDLPATHGGYDPRICTFADRYYITWCNGYHGPAVGLCWTEDFQTFHLLENAAMPFNRNGVMFPRKIGDTYALLSRPFAPNLGVSGDIFYSQSPDLAHWGRYRHVMSPVPGWNDTKIGPGPAPLETAEGWLLIYHGVQTTCNGYIYRIGAALLDLDEPWKVRYRSASYVMAPEAPYERCGDVPNVVFPCGMLADAATGRLAIYYGAADTCLCLAFAHADELIDYVKRHHQ